MKIAHLLPTLHEGDLSKIRITVTFCFQEIHAVIYIRAGALEDTGVAMNSTDFTGEDSERILTFLAEKLSAGELNYDTEIADKLLLQVEGIDEEVRRSVLEREALVQNLKQRIGAVCGVSSDEVRYSERARQRREFTVYQPHQAVDDVKLREVEHSMSVAFAPWKVVIQQSDTVVSLAARPG